MFGFLATGLLILGAGPLIVIRLLMVCQVLCFILHIKSLATIAEVPISINNPIGNVTISNTSSVFVSLFIATSSVLG